MNGGRVDGITYDELIQHTDDDVVLWRDDAYIVGGACGTKARTVVCMMSAHRGPGVVTAGGRRSVQAHVVAAVGAVLGRTVRVHTAAGADTPEMDRAAACGAEIVRHRPGYTTVLRARAANDARDRRWLHIPYGLDTPDAIDATAGAIEQLPGSRFPDVARVVVPVGFGMALLGVVEGLDRIGRHDIPVVGVVTGADPIERMERYRPGWGSRVTFVWSPVPYDRPSADVWIGGVEMDPYYEAKAVPYVRPGDMLWVAGRRGGT